MSVRQTADLNTISKGVPPMWSGMSCSLASQVSPGVPVVVGHLALCAGVSCTHWMKCLSLAHCWFPTPQSSSEWRLMRVPESRSPLVRCFGAYCLENAFPSAALTRHPLLAAYQSDFHTRESLSSNCSHLWLDNDSNRAKSDHIEQI